MATNLDYQKARRIRNTSFTDLLSDQLAGDSTITGAIRKTISLRTQARIKGFKEKFDPLNIAKFLTGGSSLGPALLGKLTGRSGRDIQYFSGRMQPIREKGTASRITKEPGTGMSEGVNEMLRKIYSLMQISRENDLKKYDNETNFAEEKKLEAEKRHRELLDALKKLTEEDVTTSKVMGGEGSSGLPNLSLDIGKSRGRGRFRNFGRSLMRAIPLIARSILLNPVSLIGTAAISGLLEVAKEKEAIEADPFNPKYDNNPLALSIRNQTTAGQEAKKNTAKALTQQGTARRGEIQDAVDSKLPDIELRQIYGADRNTLKVWLSDPKNQLWTKPNAAAAPTPTPAAPTPSAPMATPASAPPATPEPISGKDIDARLAAATNQNLDSTLPSTKPPMPAVVNNLRSTQQNQEQPVTLDLKTIAVRNTDPTFMRLIMDNTRVV